MLSSIPFPHPAKSNFSDSAQQERLTMSNKLYVGNLSYSVRDDDLQQQFAAFGNVQSAKVMMERDTGRSKGFGFVEMSSPAEAEAAIQGLHGKNFGGRDLTVNIARPMEARPPVATTVVVTTTTAAALVAASAAATVTDRLLQAGSALTR
jgi:RNA recognition motif-containing protein